MKKTLEVDAFISDTNRSPIMIVDDNIRSLELELKEIIGNRLNIISGKRGRLYGSYFAWKQHDIPDNVKQVDELAIEEIKPHTKKLKITIEIED
jgi:hypothetical protein